MIGSESYDSCVSAGLRACGVDKLFLEIHDASFPAFFQEDTGRGTPYAEGAAKFLDQLAHLGFNGIQLGPQGLTAADNPSPYDGTLFSRNPLSLALSPLLRQGLLDASDIDSLLTSRPSSRDHVHYDFAFATQRRAVDLAYERFRADRAAYPALEQQLGELWRTHSQWLEPDALYSVLFQMHGSKSWRHWTATNGEVHPDRALFNPAPGTEAVCAARRTALLQDHEEEIERYTFAQLLLQSQHRELQEHCRALGIKLYADLQIGLGDQDVWAHQGLLLGNYRMGAPPSRTNPMGQPWGFAVLDPAQYRAEDGTSGPVLDFVRRRLRKVYSEYDGVRVDHPHGWVCPWVYRNDIDDPFYAVQHGARLFSSPNLPDHPALRAFSYVEEDQLDPEGAFYADYWVEYLTEEQVDAYAQVFILPGESGRYVQPPLRPGMRGVEHPSATSEARARPIRIGPFPSPAKGGPAQSHRRLSERECRAHRLDHAGKSRHTDHLATGRRVGEQRCLTRTCGGSGKPAGTEKRGQGAMGVLPCRASRCPGACPVRRSVDQPGA
jgi:hypothetical protein